MLQPVRNMSSPGFYDVKMGFCPFLRHVLLHMENPDVSQNANTGFFLQGDFLRVRALGGLGDPGEISSPCCPLLSHDHGCGFTS